MTGLLEGEGSVGQKRKESQVSFIWMIVAMGIYAILHKVIGPKDRHREKRKKILDDIEQNNERSIAQEFCKNQKKKSHKNHESVQQDHHNDRNKREVRNIIKIKGREVLRCRIAGGRRIPYRRWHPPVKHEGMRCRMKPLVIYTSACALIVCSLCGLCNTVRTTFAVTSLVCMYGFSLFRMLVSY